MESSESEAAPSSVRESVPLPEESVVASLVPDEAESPSLLLSLCPQRQLQIQSWTSQSDWKAFPKVKGTGPSPQVRIPDTEGEAPLPGLLHEHELKNDRRIGLKAKDDRLIR